MARSTPDSQAPRHNHLLAALPAYLASISAPRLAERWSWTQQQIEAFEGSPEQRVGDGSG